MTRPNELVNDNMHCDQQRLPTLLHWLTERALSIKHTYPRVHEQSGGIRARGWFSSSIVPFKITKLCLLRNLFSKSISVGNVRRRKGSITFDCIDRRRRQQHMVKSVFSLEDGMTEIVAVRIGQRSPRSSRVTKEGDDEMKANDEREQRRGQVE